MGGVGIICGVNQPMFFSFLPGCACYYGDTTATPGRFLAPAAGILASEKAGPGDREAGRGSVCLLGWKSGWRYQPGICWKNFAGSLQK